MQSSAFRAFEGDFDSGANEGGGEVCLLPSFSLDPAAFTTEPIVGQGIILRVGMAIIYEGSASARQLGVIIGLPDRRSAHVRRFFTRECLQAMHTRLPPEVRAVSAGMQKWEVLQSYIIQEVDKDKVRKAAKIFGVYSFENTYSKVADCFLNIGHVAMIEGTCSSGSA